MRKILSLFAAMLFVFAANSAVIQITPTSPQPADNLRLALSSAATGDIIEMAAGTYAESATDYLAFTGKEVTVRAAEGAEVILQPTAPVRLKEGAKAEFIGIKFDCSTVGSYDYVIVAADDTENKRVVLNGCEFYGWAKNKAMIEATSSRRLEAITISDCYFHDCMKSVVFIENTGSINLSITNSTFANISTNTESFWAGVIDSRASAGSVLVDHCTFYNVLPMNTDYAAVGKVATPGAVVSNCIFMLPDAVDGVRAIRDVSAANNCITFNYLKDSGTGIHSDVSKTNCTQADPLFVNAAEGNFTLGEGSPALTLADGDPVGDPRWVPAAPAFDPGDPVAIYLKPAIWATDNAKFGVYAFVPQTSEYFSDIMTLVEGETAVYETTIPENYTYVVFMRLNDGATTVAWDQIWNQTVDLQRLEGQDMFTITTWGEGEGAKSDGAWSKFVPTPAPEPGEATWDWTAASYASASANLVVWSHENVSLSLAKGTSQTDANNYLGGGGNAHTRVYKDQILSITPAEGVVISSIEITATATGNYVTNFKDAAWTNGTAAAADKVITITPTDGASEVSCKFGGATRGTAVKVSYLKGAAPAVAKPAIAGEEFFYDQTAVTITCATEGAAIYYTLDGTEPTAASTPYTAAFNLNASATVKAIAILGSDVSAVVEKAFTKNPSFASFEALIAAGVADKTLIEVSFEKLVIDSFYVSTSNNVSTNKGIYFTINGVAYEIYKGSAAIDASWEIGGKVSGTIRGEWQHYVNTQKGIDIWEVIPSASDWTWAALTYSTDEPVEGCDWDNIEFLGGPAEYANQYKVCKAGAQPNVQNIQVAPWADNNVGIYVNFPDAVIGNISLPEGQYKIEGAGVLLYLSAFTAKETEFTMQWQDGVYTLTVLNVNGTDPVAGEKKYYLVGSMNNWTPGLTDDFVQNPGSEGEYMVKATLAVGDEFKVIGITSGVLNPDTTWYPGLAPNYIVDVDHAGPAKNIYFRPDGQGGEGWHYGVIFVEPNQDALKAVSDSTTWNFSKLTQNTESSLYSSSKEGILLSASTNPSITDEIIYAGYDSLWTIAADFDGEAIAFTGEYPIRKNQYCMNGKLRIKTTVAGNIYVKFSDTGTSAGDNPTRRYLVVNSDTTEYWTSRPKKNDDSYESRLNVETGAIHVPAGDVIITGSQAICVYYVTFVPDAAPTVNYYVAGSMNDWKADENYMLTPNNESLYEGEFTFAANDAFKVIGYDGSNTTWYPEGTNNDYKITEAGDYKITFNPAGNVEGWYAGFFNVVKKETPAEGPAAAPAEPAWPANQVKAVYSAKYEADCGFGEWGSGTVYAQEAYGKKYVTTDFGYFGLTFDGEGQHLNCSNMEKLHLDVWIAQDTTIRVVPIWGGAEQGIFVSLEANKWNAIDIALADYTQITSWIDVYQIKIDEARNMTFWLNNVYFYTTQAPEEDPEAPQNFTAELAETSFFSVRIKANATDNSGTVKYQVINGELIVGSATGESGKDTYITVKDLTPNTDYSFKVVAKDESGNSTEPIELAAVKTLAAPAAAHAPTMAAENVVSLYSDAYTTATTYETLNQYWWMGPATMVEAELAENDHVLYYADFAAGGSFGWAFNTEVDAAGFQKLHLDIYPTEATSFVVWPVIQPEADYKTTTAELVANQWNEVIIDLTDKTFAPFKQFGWVINKEIPGFFVDNVYFFKDAQGFENIDASTKAVKVLHNGQIFILRGDKVYTITGQPVK